MATSADAQTRSVSLAIELFISGYFRAWSIFMPKKESEDNVRRFLNIPKSNQCNDFLGVHRQRNDVWLLADGKGMDVEGVGEQFGATAAALLACQPVSKIYFQLFILMGGVPQRVLDLLPQMRDPAILSDAAQLKLISTLVARDLELIPARNNVVRLARKPDGFYSVVGNQYLADPRGILVQPLLPPIPPPPEPGLRAMPLSQWQALAGEFDTGIQVNLLQFR